LQLNVNQGRRAKVYAAILELKKNNVRPSADKIIAINGGSKDQVLYVLKIARQLTNHFQNLTPIIDFLQYQDEGVQTDLLARITNLENEVGQLTKNNESLCDQLLEKEIELKNERLSLDRRHEEINILNEKIKRLDERHIYMTESHEKVLAEKRCEIEALNDELRELNLTARAELSSLGYKGDDAVIQERAKNLNLQDKVDALEKALALAKKDKPNVEVSLALKKRLRVLEDTFQHLVREKIIDSSVLVSGRDEC
jgi:hypothetical protein